MGVWNGVGFILFFSAVNAYLWGNGGETVHLLSITVPAYSLVWVWIGLIAVIIGTNYAYGDGSRHRHGFVIATWWAANIAITTLLNAINYRGIEQQGDLIFGVPGLILDFIAQAGLDISSLILIWVLVSRQILTASIWIVIFSGFLIANLFGHVAGSYGLYTGMDAGIVAKSYDSFLYLVFTIMLFLQAMGSGSDALIQWTGSRLDLCRDIRPAVRRTANRYLHLQ